MSADGLRLDRWLWCARFFKSRQLSADEVRAGHVRLNGQRVKPAREVKPGDRIVVSRKQTEVELIVTALPARRGPAVEAQACYRETDASIRQRAEAATRRRDRLADVQPTLGRPDKRTRRLIRSQARRSAD